MLSHLTDVEKVNDTLVDEDIINSDIPDSITVELPKFDKKFSKTIGEYTVEAEK